MKKENSREVAAPGKFVAYSYKLYNDANGKLLFETPKDAPDFLIVGVSNDVVPGLMAAVEGLAKGDKFEVTLPPAAAFGDKNPDYEMTLDKEIFMRDGKLADEVKVGAALPMMTAEGFRVEGRVLEVGDKIRMDFNHPFAGFTVRYEGIVEQVRNATPEEIKSAQGCGGGCCGGGGCDSGCGGGCEGCQ